MEKTVLCCIVLLCIKNNNKLKTSKKKKVYISSCSRDSCNSLSLHSEILGPYKSDTCSGSFSKVSLIFKGAKLRQKSRQRASLTILWTGSQANLFSWAKLDVGFRLYAVNKKPKNRTKVCVKNWFCSLVKWICRDPFIINAVNHWDWVGFSAHWNILFSKKFEASYLSKEAIFYP